MTVVGLGEGSVDYVHVVPRLPGAGPAKLPIRSHHIVCGGQVATAMAACASLGLSAGYSTKLAVLEAAYQTGLVQECPDNEFGYLGTSAVEVVISP